MIPRFLTITLKEQRFLLDLKNEASTLSDIMKIHMPQVNLSPSNVCHQMGSAANTVCQVLAGLAASIAAAQIGNRLGFNPLDRVFHQDLMALDKNHLIPYVPAWLLGGSIVLSKFGVLIEQRTSSFVTSFNPPRSLHRVSIEE